MSEASWMDDVPLTDYELEQLDYRDSFKHKKQNVQAKQNTFIIVCKNHNKILYYQHISKGGYWAQFKENALALNNKEDCTRIISKMKFGKFKVEEI